jgi:hypothetical protein
MAIVSSTIIRRAAQFIRCARLSVAPGHSGTATSPLRKPGITRVKFAQARVRVRSSLLRRFREGSKSSRCSGQLYSCRVGRCFARPTIFYWIARGPM